MSNRRTFLLKTATVAAAAFPGVGSAQPSASNAAAAGGRGGAAERRVFLNGDGVSLPPAEYTKLLSKIIEGNSKVSDVYLKGGAVEELESRFAKMLGKERGLFLPTGTMANHIGVRLLAGSNRRVLVQEESHLYRDESDCAQTVSGLNLIPLATGKATIQAKEVIEATERAIAPPYPVPIGAMSIESPVRRCNGQAFDFEEMQKIAAYARDKKIRLHLDGARMFLASAYTGVSPQQYSALFETVYVSLYKYFNAPFGAVLTGPAALIEEAATLRRQFGGGVLHAWESAAIALHYLDGFEERYRKAVHSGKEVLSRLEKNGIRVRRFEGGTNVFHLEFPKAPDAGFSERAASRGIVFRRPPEKGPAVLQVNETILRRAPEEIAEEFVKALS